MPKAIRDKVGAQGWEDKVPCLFTALKVVSRRQSLPGGERECPRPPQPRLWSFRPEGPRATARGWVSRGPAEPPCLGGRHPWRKDGRAGSCPPLSSPTETTWCWSSQARRGWEEEGLQAPGTPPRPPHQTHRLPQRHPCRIPDFHPNAGLDWANPFSILSVPTSGATSRHLNPSGTPPPFSLCPQTRPVTSP